MRIFVHNVDCYLGKVLVSELRRAEGGYNRIFGTARKSRDAKPKGVGRVVNRDDPKKAQRMQETILSCKVVVMDLFTSSLEDLQFAIKALTNPKPGEALESEITFVLVSSAMVWAGTEAEDESGLLKESEWQRRRPQPGSMYEQWKEMEDLVLSTFNKEGSLIKGLVVAGGVMYGGGEDAFGPLFKDAWCGHMKHSILGTGDNRIPTVHVRDVARLVRHVMDNSGVVAAETPYFLAVDQPPAEGDARPVPSTQAEIVQGIVDEISDPFQVPHVKEWPAFEGDDEEEARSWESLQETLSLNLRMEPSQHMLDPEFAAVNDPPGWFCRGGLLSSLQKIAGEFCEERKLRAMRVLLGGPPASGKSTLAKNISEHFRIPHHELPPQGYESMVDVLSTRVCRYRGYVLDAGCMGFAEVERLFRFDLEVAREEGDEPPAGDDENAEEPLPKQYTRQLHEDILPNFVVVTQAPRGLCEGRWRQARGSDTVAQFNGQMETYAESNLIEGVHSLSDFFQEIAKCSVLNLPVAGKDEEDLFESSRIYIEREGRPFNYLPTGEEVAAAILENRTIKREEEAKYLAAELERLENTGGAVQQNEMKQQADRMAIITKHLKDHQKLKDMPLREYLMEYMVPNLTEGLIEVCKVLPENPTDYLAQYLAEHTQQGTQQDKASLAAKPRA